MLSNAYFLAKFRFDTAENEPAKILQNLANVANFAIAERRREHLPEQPHRQGRVPLSGGDPVAALQLLGGHVRPAVEVKRHLQGEALLRLEAELVADRTRALSRAELMLGHRVLEGVVKEFSYVKTPLKHSSNLWIIFGKL